MHTTTSAGGAHRKRRLSRVSWLMLAGLGGALASCELSDERLSSESFLLQEGGFTDVAWGATQQDGFYVLAREVGEPATGAVTGMDEVGAVQVVTVDDAPCSLGPTAWHAPLRPVYSGPIAVGSPSPARIPFVADADEEGVGTLRFANVDCSLLGFSVANVSRNRTWPLYRQRQFIGYLVWTARDELLRIDPWEARIDSLGTAVTSWETSGDDVWMIDGGALVHKHLDGMEHTRFGSGVRSFGTTLGGSEVVYATAEGIFRWSKSTARSRLISPEGCEPRFLLPHRIAYFAPCESRHLQIYSEGWPEGSGPVASEVQQVRGFDLSIYYTTRLEEDPSLVRLWRRQWPNGTPRPIATMANWRDLQEVWVDGVPTVALVFETSDGVLAVAAWTLASGLQVVDEGLDWWDLSSRTGALRLAYTTTWARGGILRVLRPVFGPELTWEEEVTTTGVPRPPVFVAVGLAPAIAYIDGADAVRKAGDLRLQLLNKHERLHVGTHATTFQAVGWPELGLVYTQRAPDQAGLWFARIHVPCGDTGASLLECAF